MDNIGCRTKNKLTSKSPEDATWLSYATYFKRQSIVMLN